MEFHKIADIFPLMSELEYKNLRNDILENGLIESIWLYENKIIDGRNRYNACQSLSIEPKYRKYTGNDPLNFIISLNLKRRHLSESQRAMIAAKLANMPAHRPDKYANLRTLSQSEAAKLLNVSSRSIQNAGQILATKNKELIEQVESGKKKVSVIAREYKRAKDSQAIKEKTFPVIEGKFKTILIDPPWDYELNLDGRAKPEYKTMSMEKLKALNLDKYAEKNCHLYIWSTNNNIPLALELGNYWGFSYKTLITWIKPSIGMGSYFRNSTEQLLFFVKGQLSTRTENTPTHFEAPRGKHSEKPEISYQIIEKNSYPACLEYFGRKERENWTVWGNIDV